MQITIGKIVVWLIVDVLAGWFTGVLIKRKKKGFGHLYNTLVGLAGALTLLLHKKHSKRVLNQE